MNSTVQSDQSPSLADGFNGARDAAILEKADHDLELGVCHVQATKTTRGLLKRAGIPRIRTHQFYPVPVKLDGFKRLQLAPLPVCDL